MQQSTTLGWPYRIRRDAAEIVVALLLGIAISSLRVLDLPPSVTLLAKLVTGTALLILILISWNVHVPTKAPWYRLVTVTVALVVINYVRAYLPEPAAAPAAGVNPNDLSAITLALLVILQIPAAAGYELFLRGVVYTLIEERAGAAVAILGSTAAALAMAAAWHMSPRSVAEFMVFSSLLACSRALTGSVAPAVVAQCITAALGALFVVLAV